MASEWVYDLRGKEIVFTGKFEGFNEVELTKIAEGLGASRVKDWINKSSTDLLVRGWSPHWKYGRYGSKEKPVAEMQRAGHHIQIIDTEGFFDLRSHYPAPTLKPNVPDAPARANATEGGLAGAPYRAGSFARPSRVTASTTAIRTLWSADSRLIPTHRMPWQSCWACTG
ncbi:BRCT domain-containing protein [Pseudarthrobacter sp. MDT3-1]